MKKLEENIGEGVSPKVDALIQKYRTVKKLLEHGKLKEANALIYEQLGKVAEQLNAPPHPTTLEGSLLLTGTRRKSSKPRKPEMDR